MSGQTSGMFESVAHHSSFVHVYFQPRVLSELLLPGAWCTLMAGAPLSLKPALDSGSDAVVDEVSGSEHSGSDAVVDEVSLARTGSGRRGRGV